MGSARTLFLFVLHLLCFHSSSSSAPPQEMLTQEKMRLGSTPPSCYNRCRECHPCMAVQVPTTPIQPGNGMLIPLNKPDISTLSAAASSSSFPASTSKKYTNYKPLGWKCRCGNHLFNP